MWHVAVLAKILTESTSIRVVDTYCMFCLLFMQLCFGNKCLGEFKVIELPHIWQAYCYNVSFKLKWLILPYF